MGGAQLNATALRSRGCYVNFLRHRPQIKPACKEGERRREGASRQDRGDRRKPLAANGGDIYACHDLAR